MRMSKLLRLSIRLGSERKLFPEILAFGVGKNAAKRAASGSISPPGNMLVGAPEPLIGTPHRPFRLRPDCWVSFVLKISPINVGFPLQSNAVVFGIGCPLFGSTWGATVLVSRLLKSPPIIACVGIRAGCGSA